MGRPRDRIALIEVVRPDPDTQQPLNQGLHGADVVIDALQQDSLATQRDAGIRQAGAGLRYFRRESRPDG